MTLQFKNYKDHLVFKAYLKNNLVLERNLNQIVYKLFTKKLDEIIPIQRVGGEDKDGILYIGQTQTATPFERVSLLYKSFKSKPEFKPKKPWLHGADEIYWQCQAVRKRFQFENMFVEIILCKDSKKMEREAIIKYYQEFGEVPPFNGAIAKAKK